VGSSKATNSKKRGKRRYMHPELDEGLRAASKIHGKSEMEIMKQLGLRLKKKKKKTEWRFDFRI
tara:strand:+ start:1913 stop:2104 length:192 start_codon:yes stop_codon:yes gene_type:complete